MLYRIADGAPVSVKEAAITAPVILQPRRHGRYRIPGTDNISYWWSATFAWRSFRHWCGKPPEPCRCAVSIKDLLFKLFVIWIMITIEHTMNVNEHLRSETGIMNTPLSTGRKVRLAYAEATGISRHALDRCQKTQYSPGLNGLLLSGQRGDSPLSISAVITL